jgi:hypothetical protein
LSLIPRLIDFETQPRPSRLEENCVTVVIRSGKPQTTESLCNSCYWAHIQRGFAESEEAILCVFLRQPHAVMFKVSQCTDYNDKRVPSKADMEEIAWIIRTKGVNRQVGFASEMEPESSEDNELEIVPSE